MSNIGRECLRRLMEYPHPDRLTDDHRQATAEWLDRDMPRSIHWFLEGCLNREYAGDIKRRIIALREKRRAA